jgi:hypothetical protein
LVDRPGTCSRQVTFQNESEQCTRACLIPFRARKASPEPCKEGADCLKIGGLLQSLKWMDSFADESVH